MRKATLLASAMFAGLLAIPAAGNGTASAATPELRSTQLAAYQMVYTPITLQRLLADLGYSVGTPDGIIGPRTRSAIMAFQTDTGLPVSGSPSQALFDRVYQAWNQRYAAAQPKPVPPTPVTPQANVETVMNIQQELSDRGYGVTVTGQLDSATRAAITQYERDAHLTVTGVPSESLLAKLQAAPRGGSMARLSTQQVMQLQAALNEMGYNAGPEDGVPGPRLREAVRLYQVREGLTATGEADTSLLQRIAAAGQGNGNGYGNGDDDGFNENNERQVTRAETALDQLGYDVGAVDGTIDWRTRNAVRAYQRDAGLPVTGELNRDLMRALRRDVQTAGLGGGQGSPLLLEQLLSRAGYNVGTVDGRIDSVARNAIEQYEDDWNLPGTTGPDALLQHLQRNFGGTAATLSRDQIRQVETLLDRKGYRVGDIDGHIDVQTSAAITAYQRQAGLPQTGQPNAALLRSLQTSKITAANQTSDLGGLIGSIFGQ